MAASVLMVAAENDALPGGKVGGIGDVVRDVAPALAARGATVTVVTPAYGTLAALRGARQVAALDFGFAGAVQHVGLHEAPARTPHGGVRHLVLDHPRFSACGRGRIYCDDPPSRPFATDASKFALLCGGVARGLVAGAFGEVAVVHLHDWHAGLLAALLAYHPDCESLRGLRRVFTIHNLALQGVRPLAGDPSSLLAWYPGLDCPHAAVADPRWRDCVNPMATGIRLCNAVHAVSPSYAEEILAPSAPSLGFHGGEGLEGDLRQARDDGRLFGILNGCHYDDEPRPDGPGAARAWSALRETMAAEVVRWAGSAPALDPATFVAHARIGALPDERPPTVVTSVSRITAQKVRLLREPAGDGRPALEHLLERLAGRGVYLLLGSGDAGDERFLVEASSRHPCFVFLRGYSEHLARVLYAGGDLFLMPSSFEPCGIGQMLAMRDAQPCLVHHVGGLRDTVDDGVTGFAFAGQAPGAQAEALVARFAEVLEMRDSEPARYDAVGRAAAARRFPWSDSVDAYLRDLYRLAAT